MPCPFFEPQRAVRSPTRWNARLPLIDEYEGVCRARPDNASPIDKEAGFRFCNQGNAKNACAHFPLDEARSSFRFHVLQRSDQRLELLLVEEAFYAPLAWHRHAFLISDESIEPALESDCQRAQLLAFCRSYLRRHPV